MGRVEGIYLKKKLVEILFKLIRDEHLPGVINNISFVVVDDIFQLAITEIIGEKHLIKFSTRVGRIIQTKRGLRLIYAIFAHEIGHIIHHFGLENIPTTTPPIQFFIDAEGGADVAAKQLLKKIYPNANEILLEQAEHALKRTTRNKCATEADIRLATMFFKKRKSVLLKAA